MYITCSHVLEMPSADEQQTIMTTSDGEDLEEDVDADGEEADEPADMDGEEGTAENGKTKRLSATALKSMKNGKGKNGEHANGNGKEVEIEEKPNKRKRN